MKSKHGKYRGCLFGALGIIIIVLGLIVIIGSCSNKTINDDLKEFETQVEEDTVKDNTDPTSNVSIGIGEYKTAVEDFYQEIYSYIDNPEDLPAATLSDKIQTTETSITTFLSYSLNEDVSKEEMKVVNQLRSLLDNELQTCRVLNNYYQTEDQSYLAAAVANLESIKKALDKINSEETN